MKTEEFTPLRLRNCQYCDSPLELNSPKCTACGVSILDSQLLYLNKLDNSMRALLDAAIEDDFPPFLLEDFAEGELDRLSLELVMVFQEVRLQHWDGDGCVDDDDDDDGSVGH